MNKASDLFDSRQLDMCIFEMQRLLGYDECPIYYRMQGHAMLASALDSWYEAEVSGLDPASTTTPTVFEPNIIIAAQGMRHPLLGRVSPQVSHGS